MELKASDDRCDCGFHDLVAKGECSVAGWGCHFEFMTLKLKMTWSCFEESKMLQEWGL